jgi:hypothetical protein
MDIKHVLEELRRELARVNEAILTLERLQEGAPRRGRPPGWLSQVAKSSQRGAEKKLKKRREDRAAHL